MKNLGVGEYVAVYDPPSEFWVIYLDKDCEVFIGEGEDIEECKRIAKWDMEDKKSW